MYEVKSKLTVYFEEPFWVGVYEREELGKTIVAKIVFAKEPKDYEVYEYLMQKLHKLRFSPPVAAVKKDSAINPKRMQRQISNQLSQKGVGTKAQQALKLQHEQNAVQKKALQRTNKEAAKEQKFELHKQKQKAKHKGH